MTITCEGREGHKRVIFLFKTEVYRESYQKLILKETSIILRTSLMYSTSKQLGYNKKGIFSKCPQNKMAYEVIMVYHLHMPFFIALFPCILT